MKKLILFLLLISQAKAQTNKYCELIGSRDSSGMIVVVMDTGGVMKNRNDTTILMPKVGFEKFYIKTNQATYEGQEVRSDEKGRYILKKTQMGKPAKSVYSISFNSMVGALNSMSSRGWELVSTYETTENSKVYYHWILKRIR